MFRVMLILLHIAGALCFHIHGIRMPNPGVFGHSAELECLYEIDQHNFYSLRWFLNGHQFYSFVRGNQPEKVNHKLANVSVEVSHSDNRVVTLLNLTTAAEGTYQCEVMGEKPYFEKAAFERNLTIVKLPEFIEVRGLKRQYNSGDLLEVTCTAWESWPEPDIYFTVDGRVVDDHNVEFIGTSPEEGLSHFPKGSYTSRSKLSLRLNGQYANDFLLGCHAKVMTEERERTEEVKVYAGEFSSVAGWIGTPVVVFGVVVLVLSL